MIRKVPSNAPLSPHGACQDGFAIYWPIHASDLGREQRNRYLARLDACFHLLAREPHRGHACDDIRLGYRKYHVGRHLIFYRESPEGVKIIRILHDRMDIETHLDDD